MKSLLTTTALLLSLAAGAALAQPVGGIGTSTGPSGGVVGSGTINPGTTGTINTPSTNSGSTTMYGTSPSGAPAAAGGQNLGSLPNAPATATPSTPNQAPAGGVPGTNAGVPGVNQP
jgi:hypothetical protein